MLAATNLPRPASMAELIDPGLAARLDRLDVVSRRVFAGKLQGERRSKRRGRSVEFDDYREYAPGDDLRHIDWNVFARLDRFFIKVFQEEEDLSLHVVIDASASMNAGTPSKILCAARIAMALGYIGLVNNNRVMASVIPGAGPLRFLEPLRGRRNTQRLAQFLLDTIFGDEPPAAGRPSASGGQPAPPAPPAPADPAGVFNSALRSIAAGRSGKGVMLVLSDLLIPEPGYAPGLSLLAAGGGGFETHVLQLLSPGEIDPAVEGREEGRGGRPGPMVGDVRLLDVETGRAAEITITPALLKRYRESVQSYVAQASAFCRSRGMTHALVPSDVDVAGLLMDDLRRYGALK